MMQDGFSNIGKFYKHIRRKKYQKLTNNDRSIYLLLVEYSFGYTHNIKYELQVSVNKISEELNMSKPTTLSSLKKLQNENLIERIKWQDFGPKQSYRYRVLFPKGYSINHIDTEEESTEFDKDKMISLIVGEK